jgi:hypothetical protein
MVNENGGQAFYHRGLGDIHLQNVDFEEAARQFELSWQQAEAASHDWARAYALVGLSLAQIQLLQLDPVPGQLLQAQQVYYRWKHHALMLHILGAAACLYAARKEYQRACETALYAHQHPVTWYEDKQRLDGLLAQLAALLPAQGMAAAQQLATRLNLEKFAIE